MESKKLKAKDLINVGIYTAIYIVISLQLECLTQSRCFIRSFIF